MTRKTLIQSPNAYGKLWPASSDTLRQMLGVDGKLPREGFGLRKLPGLVINADGSRELCGVWVYCKPLGIEPRGRSKPHRLTAICPHCAEHVSAGRLAQHRCGGNLNGNIIAKHALERANLA